jgi:hypothetical protein
MVEENFSPSRRSSTRAGFASIIPAPVVTSRDRANPLPTTRRCPGSVEHLGVSFEVGPALGQQRHGEHLLGVDPADLVEVDLQRLGVINRDRVGVMGRFQHWRIPARRSHPAASFVCSTWRVRRALQAIADPRLLVIAPGGHGGSSQSGV